jgi:anti-sigma B factor antagonist
VLFPNVPPPNRAPDEAGTAAPRATLRAGGDLDADHIAGFRDRAFTLIGSRPSALILDLSAAPFVDTAGLASLVTVARVAARVGVPVIVVPAPHLRRVLRVTGLDRVLAVGDESDAAGEPTDVSE